MRHQSLQIRLFVAAAVLLQPFVATNRPCRSPCCRALADWLANRNTKARRPAPARTAAIECLAENIDWLEHYIDTYGSVVAKQPDIWGRSAAHQAPR